MTEKIISSIKGGIRNRSLLASMVPFGVMNEAIVTDGGEKIFSYLKKNLSNFREKIRNIEVEKKNENILLWK